MLQILDSLKSLISPEMVSKASSVLGEDSSKVSSATTSMVSGLLASLLHKGDTPQIRSVLEDAGKSNVISNMSSLFSGNMTEKQRSIGGRFMDAILGSKAADFISVISSHSGISTNSASKLTSMISPVIAGFLGNKINSGEFTLSSLLSELSKEKSGFMGMIPAGLTGILGLSSLSDLGKNYTTRTVNTTTNPNRAAVSGISDEPKKGGYGWLKWLIGILLLLLLFFWWRSCNNSNDMDDALTVNRADTVRATVVESPAPQARATAEWTLPDSMRITGYRNGTEEQLITYLRSGDYADASDNDLKENWYDFDNIRFEFGSATQLMGNGAAQVKNIAAILKNYKDVNIKVGGYADRVGGDDANMRLSEERAKTIKNMLVSEGVAANRITTEGYGEELAKHRESAPDSQRAEDREVAMRLRK